MRACRSTYSSVTSSAVSLMDGLVPSTAISVRRAITSAKRSAGTRIDMLI